MPAPELVALSGGRRGLAFGSRPRLPRDSRGVAVDLRSLGASGQYTRPSARSTVPQSLERTTRDALKARRHRRGTDASRGRLRVRHGGGSAAFRPVGFVLLGSGRCRWDYAAPRRVHPRALRPAPNRAANRLDPVESNRPAAVSRGGAPALRVGRPRERTSTCGRGCSYAAGLPMADFRPEEPQWIRAPAWDARGAWTGVYPDAQRTPVRIEAAAWRGRPVFFEIIPGWRHEAPRADEPQLVRAPQFAAFLLVFGMSAVFVRRNIRRGIGDRRGAFRISAIIFAAELILWICTAIHVAEAAEFVFVGMALVHLSPFRLWILGHLPGARTVRSTAVAARAHFLDAPPGGAHPGPAGRQRSADRRRVRQRRGGLHHDRFAESRGSARLPPALPVACCRVSEERWRSWLGCLLDALLRSCSCSS